MFKKSRKVNNRLMSREVNETLRELRAQLDGLSLLVTLDIAYRAQLQPDNLDNLTRIASALTVQPGRSGADADNGHYQNTIKEFKTLIANIEHHATLDAQGAAS